MKLTEHFSEAELHVEGEEPRIVDNARFLCEQLLEPIRAHYQVPIHVTSGYRAPAHNKSVGGKPTSFHLYEEGKAAADFCIPGLPVTQVFNWIRGASGLPIDKVILEHDAHGTPQIIHVQIDSQKGPRRLAYIGSTGDGQSYTQVEVA